MKALLAAVLILSAALPSAALADRGGRWGGGGHGGGHEEGRGGWGGGERGGGWRGGPPEGRGWRGREGGFVPPPMIERAPPPGWRDAPRYAEPSPWMSGPRMAAPRMTAPRRGTRIAPSYRGEMIPDYRRFHLRRPPPGYAWYRTGDEFVLAAVGSGIVFDIVPFD